MKKERRKMLERDRIKKTDLLFLKKKRKMEKAKTNAARKISTFRTKQLTPGLDHRDEAPRMRSGRKGVTIIIPAV